MCGNEVAGGKGECADNHGSQASTSFSSVQEIMAVRPVRSCPLLLHLVGEGMPALLPRQSCRGTVCQGRRCWHYGQGGGRGSRREGSCLYRTGCRACLFWAGPSWGLLTWSMSVGIVRKKCCPCAFAIVRRSRACGQSWQSGQYVVVFSSCTLSVRICQRCYQGNCVGGQFA